jgi:hypothetical protein
MVGTREAGLEEMMHWWENVHLCIGSAKTTGSWSELERAGWRAGAGALGPPGRGAIFTRLRLSLPLGWPIGWARNAQITPCASGCLSGTACSVGFVGAAQHTMHMQMQMQSGQRFSCAWVGR